MSSSKIGKSSFWTPARISLTVATLSLAAAVSFTSCNSSEKSAGRPNIKVEQPKTAPAALPLASLPPMVLDASLKAASGQPIKLSTYSGKVLVVNLWATWCGPCRVEIPELVKLQDEYREKGVEVVGLSTEDPEASEAGVQEFVRTYHINYKVGWASNEVALALMQGRDAIPQSFVIGRDGRIVRRFVGFNARTTPPLIKQAVEEALKG